MDTLSWGIAVLVIVLLLAVYYYFLNTRHLTVGNHPERKTSCLHVKDVRVKENLKKKRKHVSIQSDLSVSRSPVLLSNNEIGSDEISDTEDERDNASTNPCENNAESGKMSGPGIDISEDEYNIYRSFLDKEELTECILMNGKFNGLCKYVSRHIEEWKNKQVKIAIAGNSGTGKSSLINTLRGIRSGDEGAAKTGVTETTTKPVAYPFPHNDKLLLVDLPGIGTINFPKENYMADMEVSTYDVFIIVASGRITENDVWFVKESLKNNKNVLFVRTKIDIDLANAKHDNPNRFMKDSCLAEIRNEIIKTFYKEPPLGKLSGIYLVSSRDKGRFDFPKLEETLKKMLNDFGRAMRNILKEHIRSCMTQRRKQFENQNVWINIKAFCRDLILLGMLFDLSSPLEEIRQRCISSFYLDDQSLELVSKEISISVKDIKEILKSFEEDEKTKYTIKCFKMKSYKHIPSHFETISCNVARMCEVMTEDEMTLIDLKLDIIEEELSIL